MTALRIGSGHFYIHTSPQKWRDVIQKGRHFLVDVKRFRRVSGIVVGHGQPLHSSNMKIDIFRETSKLDGLFAVGFSGRKVVVMEGERGKKQMPLRGQARNTPLVF